MRGFDLVKKMRWILLVFVAIGGGLLLFGNRKQSPLPSGAKADQLVIEKGKRRLLVLSQGVLVRTYQVALGRSPVGPKMREGDNKTPEGNFVIDWRNPRSGYHLALHISYPSPEDVSRAKAGGYSPGSAIMIHGIRNGFGWVGRLHRLVDWTRGCIALTNPEIDELWQIVPDGTPIRIDP